MNVTTEEVGNLHRKVFIEVNPDDYLPKVNEGIKALKKKANIPGFRPGMVPDGYLRNLYGNEVLADEINKLVSDKLDAHIKEQDLRIFAQPIPFPVDQKPIDIKKPDTFRFGFEMGIIPSIEVESLFGQHQFELELPLLDDQAVQDEVEKLQIRYGTTSHPESLGDDDFLFAEWTELAGDAEPEGGVKGSSSVALKSITDAGIRAQVQALRVDQSLPVDIQKAFGNDQELIIHHVLNIDHHAAEHMGAQFRLTLKSINHVEKAELNQELFDKLFGPDQVKSEDDLKARLREELEKEYHRMAEGRLMRKVRDYLTENVKMDLPQDFLKHWVRYNLKEDLTDEQLNEETDYLIKQTRWDLITDKLTTDNKIEVQEKDIRDMVKKEIRAQYFGGALEEDENMSNSLNGIADYVLKEDKSRRRYADLVLNEKMTALLLSKVKTLEKQVPMHDFLHHEHAHHHTHQH